MLFISKHSTQPKGHSEELEFGTETGIAISFFGDDPLHTADSVHSRPGRTDKGRWMGGMWFLEDEVAVEGGRRMGRTVMVLQRA